MNLEQLLKKLQEDFDYPEAGARLVAQKIVNFQPEVRTAFDHFIERGEKPTITIQDYDFDRLTEAYQMKPIAAFLTLDWLAREPDEAVKKLAKGFDTVKSD